MAKRVAAFCLWGFTTWYAFAYLAAYFGVPELLGPIVGVAVGSYVALDPRGRIWKPKRAVAPEMSAVEVTDAPTVAGYSIGASAGR
jgi:hypothetical protein